MVAMIKSYWHAWKNAQMVADSLSVSSAASVCGPRRLRYYVAVARATAEYVQRKDVTGRLNRKNKLRQANEKRKMKLAVGRGYCMDAPCVKFRYVMTVTDGEAE